MIDRRTGEVWFVSRNGNYRSFATKSQLPLGPVLRLHGLSDYGMNCSYSTYARYIRLVDRNRKPKGRPSLLKKRK